MGIKAWIFCSGCNYRFSDFELPNAPDLDQIGDILKEQNDKLREPFLFHFSDCDGRATLCWEGYKPPTHQTINSLTHVHKYDGGLLPVPRSSSTCSSMEMYRCELCGKIADKVDALEDLEKGEICPKAGR